MNRTPATALSGRLRIDRFSAVPLAERAATAYETLLAAGHGVRDVLVLKRFPGDSIEFETELARAVGVQTRPNVRSILDHATAVQAQHSPETTVLSDYERYELLRTVIEGWEWSHPYLQRAAEAESFGRDVGRVLLVSSWGGWGSRSGDDRTFAAILEELQAVYEQFVAALADRSALDQAQLISRGADALSDASVRSFVESEFEAILVVDFEEFGRLERRYLDALSKNADLYCLGERDVSIQRIWNEAGSVDRLGVAAGLTIETEDGPPPRPGTHTPDPARIATYLATGTMDRDPSGTPVTAYRIDAPTFESQLERVANEIEHRRDEHDLEYDDFAVLLRDSNQPIHEARAVLRRAGVATVSATVTGLGGDSAVRELHALLRVLTADDPTGWDVLEARVSDVHRAVDRADEAHTMRGTLERWIVDTDLKGRIARTDELPAYTSFQNVREVLEVASFFDRADFLAGGYESFLETLNRAISYVAPDRYATDLSVEENGVLVDAIRAAKYESRPVVFLIDVVEDVYPPRSQELTALFPTGWIKGATGYPGVTDPAEETVTETFSAVDRADRDPYDRFYGALARRQLAVGARVGSDSVYFCTSDRGAVALGRRRHPSRFLLGLKQHPAIELQNAVSTRERSAGGSTPLYARTSVARDVLCEPWRSLSEIERASSLGETADMRTIRTEFERIAEVVDREHVDPRFVDAVHTQIDMANGEVGTDE
ncbi:MAG: hypothetical protein ACQETB_10435 [Halobacteriota archaeon]